MKKCAGCEREIDKYTIACQYCGRLTKNEEGTKTKRGSKINLKNRLTKNS